MARSFDGSNDGLSVSAPTTSTTITMAGWFWFNTGLASTFAMTLGISGSATNNRRYLQYLASDTTFGAVTVNNAGSSRRSSGSASGLFDQWVHLAGVWSGTASRQLFINGVAQTAESTSNAPNSPDQLRFGLGHTGGSPLAGRAAECGLWDSALVQAQITLLALGFSPLAVRPADLVGYWPLIGRTSPEIDVVGGSGLTLVDAPAVAVHPRIFYASRVAPAHRAIPVSTTTSRLALLGVG